LACVPSVSLRSSSWSDLGPGCGSARNSSVLYSILTCMPRVHTLGQSVVLFGTLQYSTRYSRVCVCKQLTHPVEAEIPVLVHTCAHSCSHDYRRSRFPPESILQMAPDGLICLLHIQEERILRTLSGHEHATQSCSKLSY
jgi:hypothetical protein